MDKNAELRQRFLQFPAEESFVDYKKGLSLTAKNDFSLKLIKHIIGMCNAGGGFIVIGYTEDNAHKTPEPENIDSQVCASYDPSVLADMVEKYTIGTDKIPLVIHKEKNSKNGIIYPIIEVGAFGKRPFFCKVSVQGIFQEGALYFRVESARTIKVADPSTWDMLIDQCIAKRNDELLARFGSLVTEMGIVNNAKRDNEEFQEKKKEWIKHNVVEVTKILQKTSNLTEGLQFAHWPIEQTRKWDSNELNAAADKAIRRNTGWPIGLAHNVKAITDGIVNIDSYLPHHFDYWHLTKRGDYFYFRIFDEDYEITEKKRMWFDIRIWRVAEAIDHTIELYRALAIEPTDKIDFVISHVGLKDRLLLRSEGFPVAYRASIVDRADWSGQFSIDYLQSNRVAIIKEICNDLFNYFDLFRLSDNVFNEILSSYNKSRV